MPIEVASIGLNNTPPRAIQVPIRHAAIRVRSFQFPEPVEVQGAHLAPRDASSTTQADARLAERTVCRHHTRIRPPEDVIKLEDRLNYLLQPPLEALLADRELTMPFRPFPFQFEGVAFLYPRHAAILADEMGLGKTMQAITAIRLLLRRGEVRSVLMVCPKPLVTNWQREFRSGPRKCRRWRSKAIRPGGRGNGGCPTCRRIANYEVLIRDREILRSHLLRSGRARRIAADQEPRQHDERSRPLACAPSRLGLTGTPVENSAEDLVGIFEFLAPGFSPRK